MTTKRFRHRSEAATPAAEVRSVFAGGILRRPGRAWVAATLRCAAEACQAGILRRAGRAGSAGILRGFAVATALAALTASPVAAAAAETAEAFPSKRLTMIVPFPPGGGLDNVCRLVANGLAKRVNQAVVVENRPGAAGNIGTAIGVKAAPDGYTVICIPHSIIQGGHLYALPYDVLRDLAPVILIGKLDWFWLVRADSKIASAAQMLDLLRQKPESLSMGETGTSGKLITALLESLAGVRFLHVPYSGGMPALTGLLGGQIDFNTQNFDIASTQLKAGAVRAIAVAAGKRSTLLPDVPALGELVRGYDAAGWYGIVAPGSTPADVIRKLNRELAAVVRSADVAQRLASTGVEVIASTPEEFSTLVRSEYEKWGKVIRTLGIKAE